MIDPEPLPVLSVGAIDGRGGGGYAWRQGLAEVETRLRRLRERVNTELNVNVIHLIPGPAAPTDLVGIRTSSHSTRRNGLVVQVALPEYPADSAARQLADLLVDSLDLAEQTARRRGWATT